MSRQPRHSENTPLQSRLDFRPSTPINATYQGVWQLPSTSFSSPPLHVQNHPKPTPPSPMKRQKKRKQPPLQDISLQDTGKRQLYTPRRTWHEKLDTVFDALSSVRWTMGDFLFYAFRTREGDGSEVRRSQRQAMYASNFLQGRNTYTAATIIDLWFRGPDGRVTLADSNHILRKRN